MNKYKIGHEVIIVNEFSLDYGEKAIIKQISRYNIVLDKSELIK